jgi:hypothetical protein
LKFLSFDLLVALLAVVLIASIQKLCLDQAFQGLCDIILDIQTHGEKFFFSFRPVTTLKRNDLMAINSSKQPLDKVVLSSLSDSSFELFKKDRGKFIDVHLLIHFYHRLLFARFESLGEAGWIDMIFFRKL